MRIQEKQRAEEQRGGPDMKKWYHTRKRKMKAYGRNLRFIEDRQYDDAMHSKMSMPTGKHSGIKRKRYLRSFKKMERAHAKEQIRREGYDGRV